MSEENLRGNVEYLWREFREAEWEGKGVGERWERGN